MTVNSPFGINVYIAINLFDKPLNTIYSKNYIIEFKKIIYDWCTPMSEDENERFAEEGPPFVVVIMGEKVKRIPKVIKIIIFDFTFDFILTTFLRIFIRLLFFSQISFSIIIIDID